MSLLQRLCEVAEGQAAEAAAAEAAAAEAAAAEAAAEAAARRGRGVTRYCVQSVTCPITAVARCHTSSYH